MEYLESHGCVHRDLAARNVLLASETQAKISDFGLSRNIGGSDYYISEGYGRWPIKWYAPECVNEGKFTHASDVWSYGVLLWEMYSYGKEPYRGMDGEQVLEYVENGSRLLMPPDASEAVWELMLTCWEDEPEDRPKFSHLCHFFSDPSEKVIY